MNEILKLFLSSYTFKVVTLGCTLLGIVSAIIGTFAVYWEMVYLIQHLLGYV